MSTRLPLGWARILDCLPSSELSAASGLAASEALPPLLPSPPTLPIRPTAETTFRDGSLTADLDSIIRLSHGIPSAPPAPNLGGVAQPLRTASFS